MKTIKYKGEEAVLVKEIEGGGYIWLTFLQKYSYGLRVITMTYDSTFEDMNINEIGLTNNDLDAIQSFHTNQIDAEELGERIQLAM